MKTMLKMIAHKNFVTSIYGNFETEDAAESKNVAINALNCMGAMKFDLSSLKDKKVKRDRKSTRLNSSH